MPSILAPLRAQLRAFLAGGDFMPLWTAVMDATDRMDDDAGVSDDDREWFDELYEAVYMAADEPIAPQDRKAGVISAAELREHLRHARLDAGPPT